MGFHSCTFCEPEQKNKFINNSSGDIILKFSSERVWQMPDMILHYIHDHSWLPPQEFINDVLNSEFTDGSRYQTRGVSTEYFRLDPKAIAIGYLTRSFPRQPFSGNLVAKLESLMQAANAKSGYSGVIYRLAMLNKPAQR